ncbi:hypothetical protein ACNOYE_33385 [Nannocystaceae bacterium ST9]
MYFCVVVIGPDIAAQLQPYSLEQRTAEPYPDSVVERRTLERFAAKLRAELEREPTLDELLARISREQDWASYRVHEGRIWEFSNRNPRGEWDYWRIGGGWTGFFPLRPEVAFDPRCVGRPTGSPTQPDLATLEQRHRVDIASIEQIDFEGERRRAHDAIRARFAPWKQAFEAHGRPLPWTHYEDRVDEGDATIEEARAAYEAQAAIAAFMKVGRLQLPDCPIAKFGFDEQAYVEREYSGVLVPYAIVREGQWLSRGWDMDALGREWASEVTAIYAGVPAGTRLTAVECHR